MVTSLCNLTVICDFNSVFKLVPLVIGFAALVCSQRNRRGETSTNYSYI